MQTMKSLRLRITEPALRGYNGFIGQHEFVDGVTPHPVSWIEADRIGASIQVEDADSESGAVVSPVTRMHIGRDVKADDPQIQSVGMGVEVDGEIRQISQFYTRSELEAIADKKGLQGLRDIGTCWGVGARSVVDMIERIMKAQKAVRPDIETAVNEVDKANDKTADISDNSSGSNLDTENGLKKDEE